MASDYSPVDAGRAFGPGNNGGAKAPSYISVAALVVACTLIAGVAPIASTGPRVVSLVPAVTEMLFAMGAGDDVVGVSSYDNFPPEVKS